MVDPEEVRRVALLARLGLTPDEVSDHVGHLVSLLEHVRVIQDVDTEGVEPLTHPLAAHGLPAADEPAPFPKPRESIVTLTEHAREGFFVVPRVREDEQLAGNGDTADTDRGDDAP